MAVVRGEVTQLPTDGRFKTWLLSPRHATATLAGEPLPVRRSRGIRFILSH